MVLARPPEVTPEKEPRGLPHIYPSGLVSVVEFAVVCAATKCIYAAPLALLVAMAWIQHHGFCDKVTPSQGGVQWDALRTHSVWHIMLRHFRLDCIRHCPLNPAERCIFGFHSTSAKCPPSVVLCGGMWERLFPHHPALVLLPTPYFYVPILREVLLWLGCVEATETVAHDALNNGLSLLYYPFNVRIENEVTVGGAPNAMSLAFDSESQPSLALVKLAMMHGVSLIPVLALCTPANSERRLRWMPLLPAWLEHAVAWMSSVVLSLGAIGTCKSKATVVFGSPLHVERNARPSHEEVQEVYATYSRHLRDLFALP
ncbi:hypothetical protein, variant 2 [Aphanomyces astaci]|uniref:Acyltransferase n=2 Tax=Aphanomyces astaci TaxID=112090 RepID=W4GY87_APHAT|nr:hypothetical protein, variant 2 [Aphanomyces astaci]ETV84612.1 hypothetical protein, variant 2 [Aphanomyces astaci]|eukprot:XP_009826304.1 hypothetical protein, variant 2 [Aphanomyces astaci]